MAFLDAPHWTDRELDAARDRAAELFLEQRREEGPRAYQRIFGEAYGEVRRFFDATEDLHAVTGEAIQGTPDVLDVARCVMGPPISADDLRTTVGNPLGKRRLDDDVAQAVADEVNLLLDTLRFPWVGQQRAPTSEERERAVRWTTGVLAVERHRTWRRNQASRRQEDLVAAALSGVGLTERPRRDVGHITVIDQLDRGEFTRETRLAGSKCDVPVRLRDGRLLAIECKVSNSSVNSWKRLVRETGGKADAWRRHFGSMCVTAAVLAGVYQLGLLRSAQDEHGVTIFWQHDLGPLQDFVGKATGPA